MKKCYHKEIINFARSSSSSSEYKFNNEYVSSVKEEKEKEKIFQEQLKQQSENQNQNIKMNIKEKKMIV